MRVQTTTQPMAKEVNHTMGDLIRLSTRACIELSQGKVAFRRLLAEVDKSVADGHVTPYEAGRIRAARDIAVRELDEGLIAAEKADYTAALNEWRSKAGEDAEIPQHLRERKRDLDRLIAQLAEQTNEPRPKAPAGMVVRIKAGKRKAPADTEARRVSRQAK